jgi:hypothetical protein
MSTDCKYFDDCSAPLCPKDEGIADRTWFPDEDICRLLVVPGWVKRQKRVARKSTFEDGYFTVAMLKQDCRITQGMKGIDPNGDDREREKWEAAWFKAHPVITAEEREKNQAWGEKNKGALALYRAKKRASEPCSATPPAKKGS